MIHVLPGMGADSSMFAGPWHQLENTNFIDWPAYAGERTITEIATRVITENRIQNGDTVIGTSLGGIVGCEIANQLSLRHLVLIGSAKNSSEISSLLTRFHPLARIAPIEFLQWSAASLPGEVTKMFVASDAAFLRASCAAIFTWAGLDETRIKPFRIHGRHDHVIPAPKDTDLLLDGGHLIAMTHATECCNFIAAHTG